MILEQNRINQTTQLRRLNVIAKNQTLLPYTEKVRAVFVFQNTEYTLIYKLGRLDLRTKPYTPNDAATHA